MLVTFLGQNFIFSKTHGHSFDDKDFKLFDDVMPNNNLKSGREHLKRKLTVDRLKIRGVVVNSSEQTAPSFIYRILLFFYFFFK